MSDGEFIKTKSGILIPESSQEKPVAVECGYCPNLIWKHKEVKGKLHMVNGSPMCTHCRVMKFSKMKRAMVKDKKSHHIDQKVRQDFIQDRENKRIEQIAAHSQFATS